MWAGNRPLGDSGSVQFDAWEKTLKAKLSSTAGHKTRAGESAPYTASPGPVLPLAFRLGSSM
jgi:hypothetical protein